MPSANFTSLPDDLARGQINFASDTFKAMLVTAIPSESNLDTWTKRNAVTGEHAASGGYTAGGFNVTVASVTKSTANNRTEITFTAANPTYSGATLAGVVGCIVYKSTGNSANDNLVSFVDFNGTRGVTDGTFTVSFTTPLYINR